MSNLHTHPCSTYVFITWQCQSEVGLEYVVLPWTQSCLQRLTYFGMFLQTQMSQWGSVIGNQGTLPAFAIRGQFDVSLGQFQAGSNKLKLHTLVTEYLNLGLYNKCSIWREGDHVLQGLCVCIYNLQSKTQDAEQPINNSSVYENRPAATVHHLIHISCLCTEQACILQDKQGFL